MKKILATILAMCLMFSMAACGPKEEKETSVQLEATENTPSATAEEIAPEEEAENESDQEQEGSLAVDKGIFNVTLTLPAEYAAEGETQEYYDALAKEEGYKSVTLNNDGSVTYVMTRAQHEAMMDETRASIEESLAGMSNNEDYPHFMSIDTNEDYTEFTIHCNSDELSFTESFSVMVLYLIGGMYNAFNGTPVENVHVVLINDATGEIISEENSSDMG